MNGFWGSVLLAGLVMVAVLPFAAGLGIGLAAWMDRTRHPWLLLTVAFVAAFAVAVAATAGAAALAKAWGIET